MLELAWVLEQEWEMELENRVVWMVLQELELELELGGLVLDPCGCFC